MKPTLSPDVPSDLEPEAPALNCLVIKAASSCNLSCQYCYMAENHARLGPRLMSEAIVTGALEASARAAQLGFGTGEGGLCMEYLWHGGEPLLQNRRFFERAFERQRLLFDDASRVGNALTTNGTLIDEAWADLFEEQHVRVTVSIDGPGVLHDLQRPDRYGKGSFGRALRGYSLLRRRGLSPTMMMVVTDEAAGNPERVFDFLREVGDASVALTPCVSPRGHVDVEAYGRFLVRLFDLWMEAGERGPEIREFTTVVQRIFGGDPPLCEFGRRCGKYLSLDVDGSLYYCDFFTGDPAYGLGNVANTSIESLLRSERYCGMRESMNVLPASCSRCSRMAVCGGGCPRTRSLGAEGVDLWCGARTALIDHAAKCIGTSSAGGARERCERG